MFSGSPSELSRIMITLMRQAPAALRLASWLFLAAAVIPAGASSAASAPRPNIIVIMVDDLGYSDIGPYGSEIETPHLDALANDGLRFSQFYTTPKCFPSRAALLTGLYPHPVGLGRNVRRLTNC